MKISIKRLLIGIALVAAVTIAPLAPQSARAIDVFKASCGGSGANGANNTANNGTANNGTANNGTNGTNGTTANAGDSSICGAKADDASAIVKNIINTMLYILGIIAVIMIVIGGIRYTTSNGDSSQIKAAKDTILYAVIGLVIAIMAFAIVNFVISNVGGGSTSSISQALVQAVNP